jgi:hypothetical protein
MDDTIRILAYMAASTVALAIVIYAVHAGPGGRYPSLGRTIIVAALVSVIGILFAKFGANAGLPWWIYYTVPALCTVLIPPLVFRMSLPRALVYIVLAFATAPLIHIAFVKLLGWTDYMPFFKIA